MSLENLMKDINKQWGNDNFHTGVASYDYVRIPSSSPRINYMLYGGLPEGRLIEFYGAEHGGKTTLALDFVANYQALHDDTKVVWVDAENTFDPTWATKLGVNVDELLILSPDSQGAETIFQTCLDIIETGEVGMMVLDSLGVLVSNQAYEKSVEEKTYGGIAMALTNFSKKAEMLCAKTKCTFIGINQVRDDLNSMFGGTTTTGGKAWRHNCSVRIEVKKGKYVDDKGTELTNSCENPMGQKLLVSMTKNKTCPPLRRTGFTTIKFLEGIDYLSDLIEVAIKYGCIDKSGAWFSIIDPNTGELIEKLQGAARVREYLADENNIMTLSVIEAEIDKHITDQNEV